MAAVTPQTRQCKLGSYYPAASLVEAATSQSRLDVTCKAGKCGGICRVEKKIKRIKLGLKIIQNIKCKFADLK